jgi:hypothetical protein
MLVAVLTVLAAMLFLATPWEVAKRVVTGVLMLYTGARKFKREPQKYCAAAGSALFSPIRVLSEVIRRHVTWLSMVVKQSPSMVVNGCRAIPKRVVVGVLMLYTLARRCRRSRIVCEPTKVLSEWMTVLFGPMRVCFSIVAKRVVVAVLMLYTKARLYKREKAAKAEASDTQDEAKSTLTYFQKAEASYNRIRSSCNPGQYMMSINRGLTSSLHQAVTVFLQQCLKGFAVRFPQRCVPSAHA